MNLIKREIDKSKCNILDFREYQYSLIPELINLCFSYMETHGFTYDKNKAAIEVIDDISYNSKHHFATVIIKSKIGDNAKNSTFFEICIPKLIEGQIFILNGARYCPQFYIADAPIVVKENSISLYSLFSPITIYIPENRVIFLGNNIPISRFLKLYYSDDEIDNLNFKIDNTSESEEFILQSFSNILNIPPNKNDIKNKINKLFFDDWSLNLYKEYYGLGDNIDIKDLLDLSNLISMEEVSFIDLKFKRLVFIEYLLAPLFKAVSGAVNKLVLENINPKFLNIKISDLITNFYSTLKSSNRISSTVGFPVYNLKASFANPKGTDRLPKEVNSIHENFFKRICLVNISNSDPGKICSLIPEQNLKNLKYGIFDLGEKL